MYSRYFVSLCILLSVLLALPSSAFAIWDCRLSTLQDKYNRAIVVFEGEAIKVDLNPYGADYTAEFVIENMIKGQDSYDKRTITVNSLRSPVKTGKIELSFEPAYTPFVEGKRYLVYVYERKRISKYKHLPKEYEAYLLQGCTGSGELPSLPKNQPPAAAPEAAAPAQPADTSGSQ